MFFSFLVLHVLLYFHNFNLRPNFFFPFQSNYIQMVKLKIEASVQNHYKNKTGREDWILFQRWRLGILKITFCPSMFTYFSAVKSRLTLNYLVHAWLEIEKCVSRGTWVIWHAKIFKNDYDQWFHYVDIITHVATKHECTARVPRPCGFFFCRQRKIRRVKGKTFFVAETQCQVIIYGNCASHFLDKNKLLILMDEREARGGHHAV